MGIRWMMDRWRMGLVFSLLSLTPQQQAGVFTGEVWGEGMEDRDRVGGWGEVRVWGE